MLTEVHVDLTLCNYLSNITMVLFIAEFPFSPSDGDSEINHFLIMKSKSLLLLQTFFLSSLKPALTRFCHICAINSKQLATYEALSPLFVLCGTFQLC